MNKRIIVTFTAQPGHGSEGGVGWAFVEAAATWARARGEQLIVIVDQRDAQRLSEGIRVAGLAESTQIKAVPVPRWLIRRYGSSRTRATYLGWLPRARREVRRVMRRDSSVQTIHQVTFASALLPNALPKRATVRTIWGPVNLRSRAVSREGKRPPVLGAFALAVAPWIARWNARGIDLVIVANTSTEKKLRGLPVRVEPPIFLDSMPTSAAKDSSRVLVFSGRLTELKRPWIAIDAMLDPRLSEYSLVLAGDGPLREAMEERVHKAGLDARVRFLGHQDRGVVLATVAGARVLLHPSTTEGAPWAVGEAASLGVPAVVFEGTGADTTVIESANGGEVVSESGDQTTNFVEGILRVLEVPMLAPSSRWERTRIQRLLDIWWRD